MGRVMLKVCDTVITDTHFWYVINYNHYLFSFIQFPVMEGIIADLSYVKLKFSAEDNGMTMTIDWPLPAVCWSTLVTN